MPESAMPLACNRAALAAWDSLDTFTKGYIECMFFTNASVSEDECYGLDHGDIAPDTLEAIKLDCEEFQAIAGSTDLDLWGEEQAGRDFWYTRNGHGVGFWDRRLSDMVTAPTDWLTDWHFEVVRDRLDNLAKRYREVDVYKGDDGKLHVIS